MLNDGLFFGNTRRVAYDASGAYVYASNFPDQECIHPSSTAYCDTLPFHWVSVIDSTTATQVANSMVAGATWGAEPGPGGTVLVTDWDATALYAFSGPERYDTIGLSGDLPISAAWDPASERVFVGHYLSSGTCGLGVVDVSGTVAADWGMEALIDTRALGCPRYVAIEP